MPKNAKSNVYKEKEFNMYVLWKSLPAHLRGMRKKEIIALGFTDPLISKVIKIKNQTEFAKYFNIKDLGTLTDWNNKIKNENITSPSLMTEHQRQHLNINNEIVLPNITELKEKIIEQNKIISLLKKENTLLKNKIKPRVSSRKENFVSSQPSTVFEITPSAEPATALHEDTPRGTIFQKIKRLFNY